MFGSIVQQVFFGTLRGVEVEVGYAFDMTFREKIEVDCQRLYDRLWFFVTESLLAFTIFRDEFDIQFAIMFACLLFTKSFHWLASDRIEWVRQACIKDYFN